LSACEKKNRVKYSFNAGKAATSKAKKFSAFKKFFSAIFAELNLNKKLLSWVLLHGLRDQYHQAL
jgi:hypothetical protein